MVDPDRDVLWTVNTHWGELHVVRWDGEGRLARWPIEGASIPQRYSRQGGNEVPPLEWTRVPEGTEELALLCEDPDAPGGVFTHWVVTSIPPETARIDDALSAGAELGQNDFGELGWSGPQPPVGDGEHRYFFRLYAVDRPLGLGEGASAEDVHAAVDEHILATDTLVGLFAR